MEKNKIYVNVLKWLAIGLAVSFGVGYVLSNNYEFLLGVRVNVILGMAAIIEIGVAIAFSLLLPKLSATTAKILYLVYSALTGLNFMLVFLVYKVSSIVFIFLITSIVFALMALWGKNTKSDLSKMGTYLAISLLAVVLLMILNIFLKLPTLDLILCIAGIVIFILYIGYDMKKAIYLAEAYDESGEIYGAFQLYLDFINLFLRLLRLFGNGRDD